MPQTPRGCRRNSSEGGNPCDESCIRPRVADSGGEGGIRTHGTRKGSTVFETARFNHSRTSPNLHYLISNPLTATAAILVGFKRAGHPRSFQLLFPLYAGCGEVVKTGERLMEAIKQTVFADDFR